MGIGDIGQLGIVAVDTNPLQEADHGQKFRIIKYDIQKNPRKEQFHSPGFSPNQTDQPPQKDQSHTSNQQIDQHVHFSLPGILIPHL
jgi:hypothetical protein